MGSRQSVPVAKRNIVYDSNLIFNPNKTISKDVGFATNIVSKNIILFGETGAGKTSFVKKLYKDYIPEKESAYSKTPKPEKHSFIIEVGFQFYHLNILDTPGFKETTEKVDAKRRDDEILDIVFKCVDQNMATIDVFCVVHNINSKLTEETIDVFKLLYQYIDTEFKKNCVLLLTHAEAKYVPGGATDPIQEYIDELLKGENGEIIKMLCQGGIVVTGAYNLDEYNKAKLRGDDRLKEIVEECKLMNNHAIKTLCQFNGKDLPSREMRSILDERRKHLKEIEEKYKKQ